MRIAEGEFDDPQIIALLDTHVLAARAETARESAHAFEIDRLKAPDIRFWTLWEGETLLAVGALQALGAGRGEIKSMHTAQAARRRGAGGAMLDHIVAAARAMGLAQLSLETGSWAYFAPAHALYRSRGFVDCAPFGDYRDDPNSLFMTLAL
ncbi:MAG: GNAT family N-acetyltransferase [Sphingomonadaceae bacterium]|nr:GNAT family N-acetyltransferase [Sphingomonadaceae bacterium]